MQLIIIILHTSKLYVVLHESCSTIFCFTIERVFIIDTACVCVTYTIQDISDTRLFWYTHVHIYFTLQLRSISTFVFWEEVATKKEGKSVYNVVITCAKSNSGY
jgi:hypothetical protein